MYENCLFIFSQQEAEYLASLNGKEMLSTIFGNKQYYKTLPLNKAEIDGKEVEYTQLLDLDSDLSNYSEEVWIAIHKKRWEDTIVLGKGKLIELHGKRKF